MFRIFILADDLSGAADCGVACVSSGLKTVVALDDDAADLDAEVLSLDADTRCIDANAASTKVRHLMRKYAANQDLILFKKIDSTLRGNVAGELAAALEALRGVHPGAVAVMAPAFPAIGRTTVGGTQMAYGSPLNELEIWRHQGIPGRAYIPEILKAADLKCPLLQLSAVRSGHSALSQQLNSSAAKADVLVCDAETDADLYEIAVASMHLQRKVLWVGSAGLAYQLPRAAGITSPTKVETISLSPCARPLLFVIGSLSRKSIEQVCALTSSSQTLRIAVPPDVLLAGEESAHWHDIARRLGSEIRMGRDVVLSPEPEPQLDLAQRPLLATALACMATSVNDEIGALIASGGETARAVLQSFGVTRLRLLGEIERGIPISVTENWRRQLPVITKAGDFGGPDALLKCSQFLQSASTCQGTPDNTGKAIQ
ncbi:MAG TPA: four-carbon acid sugar kinase family protein [Terracidiphilus sp.]|nr:four-carbon acid sugar kinase family protein [Terracidiphilus sp.]